MKSQTSLTEPERCQWATKDALMASYHDEEWGVALHDDRLLFEFLVLEGAQAGLSWETVLKKRAHYRKAFDNFNVQRVAKYDDAKCEALLADPGLIRNRLKIASAVQNAKAFLSIQKDFGSFDAYIWQFTNGETFVGHWDVGQALPAETEESQAMSKDLKKRGFNFVGPTICYAFMQATGMVNDHHKGCFRYAELTMT